MIIRPNFLVVHKIYDWQALNPFVKLLYLLLNLNFTNKQLLLLLLCLLLLCIVLSWALCTQYLLWSTFLQRSFASFSDIRTTYLIRSIFVAIILRVLVYLYLLKYLQVYFFLVHFFLQLFHQYLPKIFFFHVRASFAMQNELMQVVANCTEHIFCLVKTRLYFGIDQTSSSSGLALLFKAIRRSDRATLLRKLLIVIIILFTRSNILISFFSEQIIMNEGTFANKWDIQIGFISGKTVLKL